MPKALEAGWTAIDWGKIQLKVSKLQAKIYQASLKDEKLKVVQHQKMLLNSYSAKLLAVRRVTQDERGKKKAFVDDVKSLDADARLKLASQLELDGKTTIKPLGIPTMEDRAKQALAKMALEPEWEAKFEPNSYGFRPGRKGHDAIVAMEIEVRNKSKYVLVADIKGCFDNLSYNYLLTKLKTFPTMEKQIRAWLKSGILKGDVFRTTEQGTPQGEVIASLLANIALHGLEEQIRAKFSAQCTKIGVETEKMSEIGEARLVRFGADFVVIHSELDVIQKCQKEVENWLQDRGLILHPTQSRICHTLNEVNGEKPGFDFLGFNIRTYQIGEYKSNEGSNGEKVRMLTKVKPSDQSCQKFRAKIKEILDQGHDKEPSKMINRLSRFIRGWGNYFKMGSHSGETFAELQNQLYKIYLNWGKKRFSQKGLGYITQKIFHKGKYSKWTFGWQDSQGTKLVTTLFEFPYETYIKVQGTKTPYDGDWLYWVNRRGEDPEASADLKRGIKSQKGLCGFCKHPFLVEEQIEIHHRDGNRRNNQWQNKMLVHNYCHDQIREKMGVELDNES